jgi:hypothetical protein
MFEGIFALPNQIAVGFFVAEHDLETITSSYYAEE